MCRSNGISRRVASLLTRDTTCVNIIALNMSPTLVVVPYNSPWKTLADLTNDCKAKPGHYALSSGGLYTMSHIPAELFMKAVG